MSDKNKKKTKQDATEIKDQSVEETESIEENTESQTEETTNSEDETDSVTENSSEEEQEEESQEDKIALLEKENAELKDKYLRKTADFDNYRKRMQKEKQETYDYANTAILTDLITIMDDFDRALAAGVDADGKQVQDLKPVIDGIKMINKQMKSTLENKYNLESYAEKGDEFNPDIHEAIGKCEGAVAEPTCSEVYLKGYKLKDRVIRPAKVMVTMPDGSIGD
ncbi:MAG: nucleotide exchange factor GrpE [Treponema sp. CETP13]|nr:MAG: nucleotide exchange factor GrpE [Treponema sp. CETP13]